MAIQPYLAMTALEIRENPTLPAPIAWMACHFSPYSRGLSNLPAGLPGDAVVMVNDFTPISFHDPVRIARQLEDLSCAAVVLDFQRPGCKQTAALAAHLVKALPCPVIVSEAYAGSLTCPVFLSPVPPSVPLQAHFAPWQGRELWLELALEGEHITVTKDGAASAPCPHSSADGFAEEKLHCHYSMELSEEKAAFTLWRTREDLEKLLEEAQALGVTTAVGLYQEFLRL